MKTLHRPINGVFFLGLILVSAGLSARAEPTTKYSFSSIWKMVREGAPEISAAKHELESARIYGQRMSRHWYPRVFAEGRIFSTNDPALTFMSLLGQRQIDAADFVPQSLNQPGSRFFGHGTLGLDLPLFEGNAKVVAAHAATKMAEAKSFELRSSEIESYSALAKTYASLLSLQRQKSELQKLSATIDQAISRYKIGTKGNPVGYSGLLGLKNLRNRIEGLMAVNSAELNAMREQIRIRAKDLKEDWMPQAESVGEFVATHFEFKKTTGQTSASTRALSLAAQSLDVARRAEKARFLPKVGLFAMGDLYGGSRAASTSYTGGAYLQWDLYSATNFGALGQAEHTAAAAQSRADAFQQRNLLEQTSAQLSVVALEKNLKLMEESAKYLEEQTATARDLFLNGSINALQLVEVFARRVDLVVSRAETEFGLTQARAAMFVNSDLEGVSLEN